MGKAPLMGRSSPSRLSSPIMINPSNFSDNRICSEAASMPIAIGRSNAVPPFLMSAGARLTTILVRGISSPFVLIELSIRCILSLIAESGSPTMQYSLPWAVQFTSIVIVMASTPYTALPKVFTNMQ